MSRLLRTLPLLLALALLSSGCTNAIRKARHLKRADQYFAAKEYAKAEIEYLNVLRFDNQNAHAFARLGLLCFAEGRTARAFAFLQHASELNPADPELHLKMANVYLNFSKSQEAIAQVELALAKAPKDPEAPLILADAALTAKERTEVRQRLDQLKAQVGETAPLLVAFGTLELRAGNIQGAQTNFLRAQALDSKCAPAYSALGALYLSQKDLKAAEQAFKTAAELSPEASPRRLRYAEFELQTGNIATGKEYLAAICKAAPDFVPAWLSRAELALVQHDFTNCAPLLTEALSRDPDNYAGLLVKGRLFLETGQASNAIPHLLRVKTLYDRAPAPSYFLALAYLLNNDSSKAVQELNHALALNPNFTEASLLLAQLDVRKGNLEPAISSLRLILKRQPQTAQAYLVLADAYQAQKRPEDALGVYQNMMAQFPRSPEVPLLIGLTLAQQNRFSDARTAFNHALELAPDSLQVFEQLINLDLVEKHYSAALERIGKEQGKNPTNAVPYLLVAKVHLAEAANAFAAQAQQLPASSRTNLSLADVPAAQPELQQAEAALLKAIELQPSLPAPHLLLAQLYVQTHKEQQALQRLNDLVAHTNSQPALMQIALIHEQLKDYPTARKDYERLLDLFPDDSSALNNLAYLYSERLNQPDKAYELAERAWRLQPNSPSMADTFGWILYRKGEFNRALSLLMEAASRAPAEGEIQLHLGMTHYMLDEEAAARVALERALQSSEDFPGKDEGRRRLAILALDTHSATPAVLADLEQRHTAEPADPVVASRLAALYARQGKAAQAARLYEDVSKQNPQNAQILGHLAELYADRLNQPDKALELAKEAHNLAPDDPGISHTLGRLAYQSGDCQWGVSLLQEAARKLSTQPEVLYDLARAKYSVGQVGDAETAMRSAVQLGGFDELEDAKRFLDLIVAAKTPAAAQAAGAEAAQALKAHPNYLPALFLSGVLQEQQGDFAAARKTYEGILAGTPSFLPATRNLAVLDCRHFESEAKGYDLALKARQAYPSDPEVAFALGVFTLQRGDASRAAQLLKESAQTLKADSQLLYYLGTAQYRLKQPKDSKQSLQNALALNLPPNFASEAKRMLAELDQKH